MPFVRTAELVAREPKPGWLGRFFHSEHMTFSYYEIAPGSVLHSLRHPNEEVWNVIEGELEMVVGDATSIVRAGDAAVVPAHVEHSASALQRCRAIVVDHPIREQVGGIDLR
jgi:mannose-6-phosphate isomerase-like protein (cupin superfamily)